MKNLLNITLSTIVALFFMTSCEKNDGAEIVPEKEVEISNKEMANDKNPYDKTGAIHNEYLDFFIKNVNTSEEINLDRVLLITEKFYAENELDYGGDEKERYVALFNTYAEAQEIGGPVIDYICRQYPWICDIITPSPFNPLPDFNFLSSSNGGTSTDRTLEFIEKVKSAEVKLINDERLEGKELETVLNYFAVARYSAAYWHNVAYVQKGRSPWHGPFTEAEAAEACHVCDVVGADAAGAVVGGIAGPVGAGVGAGVASAGAVLEKLWRWW